jgi:hypothetical protein
MNASNMNMDIDVGGGNYAGYDIPDITQEEIEELCCYRHSFGVYIE